MHEAPFHFEPSCHAMMCTAVFPCRASRPSCFCDVEICISWSRGAGGFPRHLARGLPPRPAIASGRAPVGCVDTTSRRPRSARSAGGRAVGVSRTTPIGGIPRHHCRPRFRARVSKHLYHPSLCRVCMLPTPMCARTKQATHIPVCSDAVTHTWSQTQHVFLCWVVIILSETCARRLDGGIR